MVTTGTVVSLLTMNFAYVRKSHDVLVHTVLPGAAFALPAASVNLVAPTVTVTSCPSTAGHSSVQAVPDPAMAGLPELPQFSTVMSWVVLSCTNRSVTGVSLSVKVKVMVLASL